jgi:hypothetical protein
VEVLVGEHLRDGLEDLGDDGEGQVLGRVEGGDVRRALGACRRVLAGHHHLREGAAPALGVGGHVHLDKREEGRRKKYSRTREGKEWA